MSQLHKIVRRVLLEVGGSERADDRTLAALSDPAARRALGQAAVSAGKMTVDFGKSLGELAVDTVIYFRTGQHILDAVKVMVPPAHAPKDEREVQAAIAGSSLHGLLDNLGTAGLDAADVVNGGVYMLERNWKMAALCLMASVPVVGSALVARKAGKFSIAARDVAKVDAGIAELKGALRKSSSPGAEETIREIDRLRSDMNVGKADFNPYDEIPEVRRQAAEEAAQQIEQVGDKLEDYKRHLSELRAENSRLPAGDPRRYTGLTQEDLDAVKKTELVRGEEWSPAIEQLSDDMMSAWSRAANKKFFRDNVKKVHWFGLTRQTDAIRDLERFLAGAAGKSQIDLSTVGYTGPIIPAGTKRGGYWMSQRTQKNLGGGQYGPVERVPVYVPQTDSYPTRIGLGAGSTFYDKFNEEDYLADFGIHLGVEVDGDVVFASSRDAYTKNPKLDAIGKGDQFRKKPRPGSPEGDLQQMTRLKDNKNAPVTGPENWVEPKEHPDAGSKLYDYNEVVVEDWRPKAVIVNPDTVTGEQLDRILELAESHGVALKDGRDGSLITQKNVKLLRTWVGQPVQPTGSTGETTFGTRNPRAAAEVDLEDLDPRTRQYESARRKR